MNSASDVTYTKLSKYIRFAHPFVLHSVIIDNDFLHVRTVLFYQQKFDWTIPAVYFRTLFYIEIYITR